MIEIDFTQPIFQQIIDGITKRLVRGDLKAGDQIPSQRDMAEIIKVSPNTVQRAYRDLEAMGVVETQRGQGTFVSAGPELVETLRRRMLAQALQRFTDELRGLGFDRAEIPALVQTALAEQSQPQNSQHHNDGDRR